MGTTRKGKDLLGENIDQHYTNENIKDGTTRARKDILGEDYDQHLDGGGVFSGSSRAKRDITGDDYTQHRDKRDDVAGTTRIKKGVLGEEYEQHYDAQGNESGYTEYRTDILGERIAIHRDMHGNEISRSARMMDKPANQTSDPVRSEEVAGGDSWAEKIMSFLFHFSRTIDKGETPISYVSPAAMIIGLIYYVVEVIQTWSVSAMEGIAALLIAWIIVPIFGVIAAVVAAALVLVKKIVRKNQSDA